MNYESDFLALSGIPANQCHEYPHTAMRYMHRAYTSIPFPASQTVPIARYRIDIRTLIPRGPVIVCYVNGASSGVIGNSVSTIIPRTFRKTRAWRGPCDRSPESSSTPHSCNTASRFIARYTSFVGAQEY